MTAEVSAGFITAKVTNLCLQTPPASAGLFLELQPHASISPAIKSRLNDTSAGLQGCPED